jgi:diketogulonate reductase-like aldo/keto reductase
LGIVLIGYGTSKSLTIYTSDVIASIATRLSCSPTKVVLRWMYQIGVVSIPRSSNAGRQRENLNVLDIELTAEDVAALNGLNEDYPYYWDPEPNRLATRTTV